MKFDIRKIAAMLLVLAAASACKEQNPPVEPGRGVVDEAKLAAFMEKTVYGSYDSDLEGVFLFDKSCHELVYNVKSGRFVIQDDELTALFTAVLTKSESAGFHYVEITSSDEEIPSGTYAMKIVKSDEDTVWLWEVSNAFGLVILQ